MSCDTSDDGGSLELIRASELYPKKPMKCDEENLHVPYPVLCGESVLYLGKTSEGVVALSNFRLFVRYRDSFVNIPLGLIEMLECRDIFFLYIYCKDAHSFRCTFDTNQACMEWYSRLTAAVQPPSKLADTFAFVFHAWCKSAVGKPDVSEHDICYQLCRTENAGGYSFGKEVERLGFNLKKIWRISYINDKFEVCGTYPRLHIVPSRVEDEKLVTAANFRACRRFPAVVWRDQRSGAVLARSSQPEVGWLGWRNEDDEALLKAILKACLAESEGPEPSSGDDTASSTDDESSSGSGESGESSRKMLIMDARSYTAAVANRAKGGGCECNDYYPNCDIQFMNLANIHTIRKSFHALRTLCTATTDHHSWLTGLEATRWLSHMSALMRAALLAAHAVHTEGRPVLVHCSDGWDRTPQIVALAQLVLDPYYRTMEGFRVLIEKEWLEFGHKFADRCGVGKACEDVNERCPVFLQWLDCVHQLLAQYPCAFHFNQAFLVKLAQHTYSNLFGTFLGNNVKERQSAGLAAQTTSLWTLLGPHNRHYVNSLYDASEHVLHPSCQLRDLRLWRAVYLSEGSASTQEDLLDPPPAAASSGESLNDDDANAPPPKTRSCENLACVGEPEVAPRRLSDPSIVPERLAAAEDGLPSVHYVNGHSEVTLVNGETSGSSPEDAALTNDQDSQTGAESEIAAASPMPEQQCEGAAAGAVGAAGPSKDASPPPGRSAAGRKSVEGSTETLTGDFNTAARSSQDSGRLMPHTRLTNMSTSTSDISDSHVQLTGKERPAAAAARCSLHVDIGRCNGQASQGSSGHSTDSEASSHNCSPSPGGENKVTPWPWRMRRGLLDVDGLSVYNDPVQVRMAAVEALYSQRLQQLERQLHLAKAALLHCCTNAAGCPNAHDLPSESDCEPGEPGGGGGGGSTASDASWEQLDESEAELTKWIPNHAVTHCAGCDSEFWIAKRKHHCRKCGLIFCSQCSQYCMPIPDQQLDSPVRVCNKCFSSERASSPALLLTNGHHK